MRNWNFVKSFFGKFKSFMKDRLKAKKCIKYHIKSFVNNAQNLKMQKISTKFYEN
jgi:hypothetical protein